MLAPLVGCDGWGELVVNRQLADPGHARRIHRRGCSGRGDGGDPGVVGHVGQQPQATGSQFVLGRLARDKVELYQHVDALPVWAGEPLQPVGVQDICWRGLELARLEVDGVGDERRCAGKRRQWR